MLKSIQDWLKQQLDNPQSEQDSHTVEVATAVLCYEIMRADDQLDESEQAAIQTALSAQFNLTDEELSLLLESSRKQAGQAADFVQFTRVINARCNNMEKIAIFKRLWAIAFADGVLDPDEEHLMRRIADLLYLSHSEFIQTKLAAQQIQ